MHMRGSRSLGQGQLGVKKKNGNDREENGNEEKEYGNDRKEPGRGMRRIRCSRAGGVIKKTPSWHEGALSFVSAQVLVVKHEMRISVRFTFHGASNSTKMDFS
eukprot:GHVT01074123.1.p1 GENE.GHVT01074123.1~~GHVT01074123.1.p1  ORF type:complete len:103 (-),score=12.84 GHVT01074123.1:616-924(-)